MPKISLIFISFLVIFLSPQLLADLSCSASLYSIAQKETWQGYFSYEEELKALSHESKVELGPFRLIKNFEDLWVLKIIKLASGGKPNRVISSIKFSEERRTAFVSPTLFSENFSLNVYCAIKGPLRDQQTEATILIPNNLRPEIRARRSHFLRRIFANDREGH